MSVNYSFVKTPEELTAAATLTQSADFFEQEKIQVFWTIEEEVARRVLPPRMEPFMPLGKPVMLAYISYFGRPKYLYPYTEGALFMLVQCEGRVGVYCFAMPLDGNDQAMDAGRQFFGYPKKQAFVKLEQRGDKLFGFIERNDVRFFEVELTLGEPLNDLQAGPIIIGAEGPGELEDDVLILKYDLDNVVDEPFVRNARINAQRNVTRFHERVNGRVERMEFRPSEDDPWIELAPPTPDHILGGQYIKYKTGMKPATRIYTYAQSEYDDLLPYLWPMWDTALMGKVHRSHRTENFWR